MKPDFRKGNQKFPLHHITKLFQNNVTDHLCAVVDSQGGAVDCEIHMFVISRQISGAMFVV